MTHQLEEEDDGSVSTGGDSSADTSVTSGDRSDPPSPVAAGSSSRRVAFASPIATIQLVDQFTPGAFRISPEASPQRHDEERPARDADGLESGNPFEDSLVAAADATQPPASATEYLQRANLPLPPPPWMHSVEIGLRTPASASAALLDQAAASSQQIHALPAARVSHDYVYDPCLESRDLAYPSDPAQFYASTSAPRSAALPAPAPYAQLPASDVRSQWDAFYRQHVAATSGATAPAGALETSSAPMMPFSPFPVFPTPSPRPFSTPSSAAPFPAYSPVVPSSFAWTSAAAPSPSYAFLSAATSTPQQQPQSRAGTPGLYYPTRASFELEEAELDAQIAAAQLSLMSDEDTLAKLQQRARQRREQESKRAATASAAKSAPTPAVYTPRPSSVRDVSPTPPSSRPRSRGVSPAPSPARHVRTPRSRGVSPSPAAMRARESNGLTTPIARSRSASVDHTAPSTTLPFPVPMLSSSSAATMQVSSSLLAPTASSARKQARPSSSASQAAYSSMGGSLPTTTQGSLNFASSATPRGRARERDLPSSAATTPRAASIGFGSSTTTGRSSSMTRSSSTTRAPPVAAGTTTPRTHERVSSTPVLTLNEMLARAAPAIVVAPPSMVAPPPIQPALVSPPRDSSSEPPLASPKKRARIDESLVVSEPLSRRVFVRPQRSGRSKSALVGGSSAAASSSSFLFVRPIIPTSSSNAPDLPLSVPMATMQISTPTATTPALMTALPLAPSADVAPSTRVLAAAAAPSATVAAGPSSLSALVTPPSNSPPRARRNGSSSLASADVESEAQEYHAPAPAQTSLPFSHKSTREGGSSRRSEVGSTSATESSHTHSRAFSQPHPQAHQPPRSSDSTKRTAERIAREVIEKQQRMRAEKMAAAAVALAFANGFVVSPQAAVGDEAAIVLHDAKPSAAPGRAH